MDIDDQELKKPTIQPDMPICADVHQLLEVLLRHEYTPNPIHADWVAWCRHMVEKYPAVQPQYHSQQAPLNP